MFRKVTPRHFLGALAFARGYSDKIRNATSAPEEYADTEFSGCYLTRDEMTGYAIKSDGELCALFSLERGRGGMAVRNAIGHGATHLDHFDITHLNGLYAANGFGEYRRAPNWDAGGPDVVYRRLSR